MVSEESTGNEKGTDPHANEAVNIYNQASALYKERKYSEALLLLERLPKSFARHPKVVLARLRCLEKLGRFGEALDVCRLIPRSTITPAVEEIKTRIEEWLRAVTPGTQQAPDDFWFGDEEEGAPQAGGAGPLLTSAADAIDLTSGDRPSTPLHEQRSGLAVESAATRGRARAGTGAWGASPQADVESSHQQSSSRDQISFEENTLGVTVTLRRDGEGGTATLVERDGREREVIHFPSFKLGMMGSFWLGMGCLVLKDSKGKKRKLRFSPDKDNDRLFKWLYGRPNPHLDRLMTTFDSELRMIEGEGVSLEEPFLGMEVHADSQNGTDTMLLLALAGPELIVFRESTAYHPLFSARYHRFRFGECHFQKGMGSAAADLGFRMGALLGGSGCAVCRIHCPDGTTYSFQAAKDKIDAILQRPQTSKSSPYYSCSKCGKGVIMSWTCPKCNRLLCDICSNLSDPEAARPKDMGGFTVQTLGGRQPRCPYCDRTVY